VVFSVGRAGKATAPPENVTIPSTDAVVTTAEDVEATVVMSVEVGGTVEVAAGRV